MAPDPAQLLLYAKLMLLLGVANGAPLFGQWLLGDRFARPLDGGTRFLDGRRLFGQSKTVRGVALALVSTPVAAELLGFGGATGFVIGLFAMAGDLTSSFTKRRLGLASSAQAFGLDQIPESLFPLLAVRARLGLGAEDIVLLVVAFVVLELAGSRVLYRLRLRDRPY